MSSFLNLLSFSPHLHSCVEDKIHVSQQRPDCVLPLTTPSILLSYLLHPDLKVTGASAYRAAQHRCLGLLWQLLHDLHSKHTRTRKFMFFPFSLAIVNAHVRAELQIFPI